MLDELRQQGIKGTIASSYLPKVCSNRCRGNACFAVGDLLLAMKQAEEVTRRSPGVAMID
jgi:hypothetical protein